MGDPSDKKKPVKRIVSFIVLVAIGLTGLAAVKVVPPMIFHQRVKSGLEAVMKTPVEVGTTYIALDLTTGYVQDISAHNPPGYKGTQFLELPRITFELYRDSIKNGPLRFKHITLHDPILYFETQGQTSNLRQMIDLMFQPGGEPMPPVIIDTLVLNNGKILSVFEYGDGKPVITDFPLKRIDHLQGDANQIAGQFTMALQKEMDAQMKETVKELNEGLFQKFKDIFKKSD